MAPKRTPWHEKVVLELARRGWSGAELGRRIGKNNASLVSRWLRGETAPTEGWVRKIAAALDLDYGYLTDDARPFVPGTEGARAKIEGLGPRLSDEAARVLTYLGDREIAAWLARCLDQFLELRERAGGPGRGPGRPPA